MVPVSKIWEMNSLHCVSVLLRALPEFSVALLLCIFTGKIVLSLQMRFLKQTFEGMCCYIANIADVYLKTTYFGDALFSILEFSV